MSAVLGWRGANRSNRKPLLQPTGRLSQRRRADLLCDGQAALQEASAVHAETRCGLTGAHAHTEHSQGSTTEEHKPLTIKLRAHRVGPVATCAQALTRMCSPAEAIRNAQRHHRFRSRACMPRSTPVTHALRSAVASQCGCMPTLRSAAASSPNVIHPPVFTVVVVVVVEPPVLSHR